MLSGRTTIHFETELIWPNLPEMAIKKEQIIALYNRLHEGKVHAYENMELQSSVPTLSTKRAKGVSMCQIGVGSLKIIESDPASVGMDCDGFTDQVVAVVKALQLTSPIIGQRCSVQCTVQPQNSENSLDLLAGKVANVMGPIAPFERPPSFFGVRFRFAPFMIEVDEPEPEEPEPEPATGKKRKKKKKQEPMIHKGFLTLRFETYSKDMKKVWIDVRGQYIEGVINPDEPSEIVENIRHTYKFATENAVQFMNQFDTKVESDDKEKD